MDFTALITVVAWLGLVTTRMAVAFLVTPYFAPSIFTTLSRSMIVVVLALIPVATVPFDRVQVWQPLPMFLMLLREGFVGLLMGFLLSVPIWVVQNVGSLMDFMTGSNNAAVYDPMSGHEGGALASVMQNLFVALFFAMGGFGLIAAALFDSYRVWPIGAPLPDFGEVFRSFWVQKGDELYVVTAKMASPLAATLLLVDFALGLINRSAPQFNVFSLSPAIKGVMAILVLYVVFAYFADRVLGSIVDAVNMPTLFEAMGSAPKK